MEPRVDFSRFFKVKDSLKEKLVREYDRKKALADDELDEVAAAASGPPAGSRRTDAY